jgi:hypothetical protein
MAHITSKFSATDDRAELSLRQISASDWVAIMDRRGQAPMLILHGYTRIKMAGPIKWHESIMICGRDYNDARDRQIWSIKDRMYDDICDYLASVGRIAPSDEKLTARPPLEDRHSYDLRHAGDAAG